MLRSFKMGAAAAAAVDAVVDAAGIKSEVFFFFPPAPGAVKDNFLTLCRLINRYLRLFNSVR